MTETTLDQLRTILPKLDPATLTGEDQRAMLDVLAASFAVAGLDRGPNCQATAG